MHTMYVYNPFAIFTGLMVSAMVLVGIIYFLICCYDQCISICHKTKITYHIENSNGIFGSFYIETTEGPKEVYFPDPQGRVPDLFSTKEDITIYVDLPFTAKLYPFIRGKFSLKPERDGDVLSILLNDHLERTAKHGIQLLVMGNKNYMMREISPPQE